MAGGVCSVAGLVTERFGGAKTSMPGGFTPPEQMKSTGSPWGLAHGVWPAMARLSRAC